MSRPAKRDPGEWAVLVRKLQEFEQTDVHHEIVAYLKYLRDDETGWCVEPSPVRIATMSGDDLRAALLQRYAYNRAILAVSGLLKYAKHRAASEEAE